MAVRSFVTGNSMIMLPGALVGKTIGPFTFAVLYKRGSDTDVSPIVDIGPSTSASVYTTSSGSFDGGKMRFQVESPSSGSSNDFLTAFGGSNFFTGIDVVPSSGWLITVATKASGSSAVRVHHRVLDTSTTTRISQGSSLAATAAILSTNRLQFGKDEFGNRFVGKMAGAAAWDFAMSDTQVDALWANLRFGDWYNHAGGTPIAMWRFNQYSTTTAIVDDTGGGANQDALSGTTIDAADDPTGWNFYLSIAAGTAISLGNIGNGTVGQRGAGGADTTEPIANVVIGSSGGKISSVTGKNSYPYSFTVNESIQAWKIKVVPASNSLHTAGTTVESGGAEASGATVSGTITAAEMIAAGAAEGSNIVKVFAQDSAGNWSTA